MLACTILTFALCADPRVSGSITLGSFTVPIVWSHASVPSCLAIGLQATGEAGLTQLETAWHEDASGRIAVRLSNARIDMTAYTWKKMSAADNAVLQAAYRATLWHEIGHLRTAQSSLDAINADPALSVEAGMARFRADQDAYDAAAEHGLRQEALPPPLGGPNTILECPSGRR